MTRARGRASGIALVILVAVLGAAALAPSARAQGPRVLLTAIDGPIDQATLDYMGEAIEEARSGGYAALVLRINTPGGSLDVTEAISSLILTSGVPVLGWVGPAGAHAWSAGTIILETTDIAGLAPGSTMGSVQPVVVTATGTEPVTDEKIINAVVDSLGAKIAVHVLPDRNESLARAFVVDNLNLDAVEAVERGAAEYVAGDEKDLLRQADGDRILVEQGGVTLKDETLSLADAQIITFSPSLRVRFLDVLTDPLVASLLLILGIYALIFGLTAPGHGGEIAGTILILLALIGLGFSVDPVAIFLIILGIILIIVELKTPGFGAFGAGGIAAIAIAAVFLAPLRPPEFVVTPEYQVIFLVSLLAPTIAFGAFLLFALYKVMEIRRRKPQIGAMVADTATTTDPIRAGERGYVMYQGELWQAIPSEDVEAGAKVYIHGTEGIVLRVATSPPTPPAKVSWIRRLVAALSAALRPKSR